MLHRYLLKAALALLPVLVPAFARAEVTVTVENPLNFARTRETIELPGLELLRLLSVKDPRLIRVVEAGGGELLAQAVDLSGDGIMEQFIFQADFEPLQVKTFKLSLGAPRRYSKEDFRAYGRFARERFDDFAWENDRVAYRMYGPALETWQQEPLTSSGVDVWCKRVRKLIINDWYMVDDYHDDHGEGADFYSAGRSRGCGGSGVWDNGKLQVSRNFMDSKVLANGPIRVVFDLIYPPWRVAGRRVAETKRISLDAGHNLSRFETHYLMLNAAETTFAAGIKKNPGSSLKFNQEEGWLRTWEPIQGDNGHLGCGIVADPRQILEASEDDVNYLLLMKYQFGVPASYYAGFGWDRSGDFPGVLEWEEYLRQYAARLRTPMRVTVSGR
jgi:hypothetical protein